VPDGVRPNNPTVLLLTSKVWGVVPHSSGARSSLYLPCR